jgi:hypothetical protein
VIGVACGCTRPAAIVADGGVGAVWRKPDAGSYRVHRSTDLRTAMLASYPEFRGAQVVTGKASLARRLDHNVPLEDVVGTIEKNGFAVSREDDRLSAVRAPFTLEIVGPVMTVSMPIVDADISKLMSAASSLTTEQMALWFPPLPALGLTKEMFRFQLRYEASGSRAGFLAWQMVDLNTQGTWRVAKWPAGYELTRRPDGGGGGVPEEYSLELVDSTTTATIKVHRKGAFVDLSYELRTEELR